MFNLQFQSFVVIIAISTIEQKHHGYSRCRDKDYLSTSTWAQFLQNHYVQLSAFRAEDSSHLHRLSSRMAELVATIKHYRQVYQTDIDMV